MFLPAIWCYTYLGVFFGEALGQLTVSHHLKIIFGDLNVLKPWTRFALCFSFYFEGSLLLCFV